MFKKYWTLYLGLAFVFLSFLYFIKLAFQGGLFPPILMVAIGILFGISGLFGGHTFFVKENKLAAEVSAGIGAASLYVTLAYAAFSPEITWSFYAYLVALIAVNALVVWLSLRFDMRILTNLSLAAGLITPLVLKASEPQVILLFLYALPINLGALGLSVVKRWQELRVSSFALTLLIYISYYIYFEPIAWSKPFGYITCFFLVYAAGLIFASWRDQGKFEGLNLYLGAVNAINYVFWTFFIFTKFNLPYSLPILFVGLIFLISSFLIYKLSPEGRFPILTYFVMGILVIAMAGPDFGRWFETAGLPFVIQGAVWMILAVLVFTAGYATRSEILVHLGLACWGMVLLFWFSVAWDVEWVSWFGLTFMPFINPGALLWIMLAVSGFVMSRLYERLNARQDQNTYESLIVMVSFVSHLVVGGLLTIQIQNVWQAYELTFVDSNLMLSLAWGLYALLLSFWGVWVKSRFFRLAGTGVLIFVAAKALLYDLAGQASMYKAGFLFLMGLIILSIFFVDNFLGGMKENQAQEK